MESEHNRSPLSPANRLAVPGQAQRAAYITRSSKKKLGQRSSSRVPSTTPEQKGEAGDAGDAELQSESTPLMTMTTRSRAHLRSLLDAASGSETKGAAEQDTAMQDLAGGGGSPEKQAAAAKSRDHKPGSAAQPSARNSLRAETALRRSRAHNPVIRLTYKLLDTYQGINEKYYAKHKKTYNNGHDDDHGDYIIRPGDMVNGRYEIARRPNGSSPLLGKGSFGQVVYALDRKVVPNKEVAVKIIKNHRHWHEQAKCEIDLLKRFTQMQPVPDRGDWVDYANVVRLVDDFVFHSHCCLVFELLPFTLYDLLKISRFRGVSLVLVSRFAQNLMRTLDCLRHPDVDVIHCDLKPENVMLCKHDDHRVKVIDFGSSCSSKRQPFTYIQSRFYRSPEVLLCRPYSHAIDMWSLGCILVEMHTGQPLFNGKNEAEQMRKIVEVLGMPPTHMIAGAGAKSKVKDLFVLEGGVYKLNPDKASSSSSSSSDGKKRRESGSRDLKTIIRKPTPQPMSVEQERDYDLFEDLLRMMLHFDPAKRVTPKDALSHPFLATGASDKMEMSPRPETPHSTPRADKVDQAVQTHKMK
eukprot:CAMPEP_0181304728 /NCGR_PEP_ID=MMETSP1101-20121128/9317_1 /TAXON_ID=46948 /ORGANISM="Rhodomonas abbreviata, Strain Caron Lab Isolate" /LENGTH=579 /DNA_ID=CAMNT_0023410529 /DNA_START=616 /DNA_END=2355 /DNA_ORIENTATION=+